ncbi:MULTISPECIES: TolC family outer membrane protein [unclassified Bartonella]|uniref:TolC family outer membrane protein n=1 Tax=unclassified Bartonella TaxID=2645622 RepID=UPI0015FB8942|nr:MULTISPECIES: TolC family outer membrane protein [unclassified Bartonella]UXN04037.1 TolC family outer membrane protein [Bartonella sp. HY406]
MQKKTLLSCLFALGASVAFAMTPASADSLKDAWAQTYKNNPTLNSARANARITDEDVAIARSGMRPIIQGTGSLSRSRSAQTGLYTNSGSLAIQVSQSLFDGFQTANNVRAAQAQAAAQREALRNEEQNQLTNAVSAYADLYAKQQIVGLRRQNLAALDEQVRVDQSRLDVGEGTQTNLAQSRAARSQALSELAQAEAAVKSAQAYYRQIIGVEPGQLERPALAKALAANLNAGYTIADTEHPAIVASKYALDAQQFNVKSKEGALLPQADLSASSSYNHIYKGLPIGEGRANSAGVSVTVPVYQGGRLSAQVRQSKEQVSQATVEVEVSRDTVRSALTSAWSQLEGARSAVSAYNDSVKAARIALNGRSEEYQVGQATTLDVLESRSVLINAQIALAQSERDTVIASYNVQSALGRMTADYLGLDVDKYDPMKHYDAVQKKWIGINTPQ